jgi:hypothetical protein
MMNGFNHPHKLQFSALTRHSSNKPNDSRHPFP